MVPLHITSVSTFGTSYLRVHGQLQMENMQVIDSNIASLLKNSTTNLITSIDKLYIGIFCLARNDNKFVRARVVRILPTTNSVVVHYMDYGFDRLLLISELRLTKFPKDLELLDAQATPYIVCGIRNEWKPNQLQDITNDILWRTVDAIPQVIFSELNFAEIMLKNRNLADIIIEEKGYGSRISFDQLRNDIYKISKPSENLLLKTKSSNSMIRGVSKNIMPVRQLSNTNNGSSVFDFNTKPVIKDLSSFRSMIQGIQNDNIRMPRNTPPLTRLFENMSPPKSSVATFKSTTLLVGKTYDIECCFVENGPCSFSVHRQTTKHELHEMMNSLEKIQLQNIAEKPTLGMACLSRFSQDNNIYRAIIMNIKNTVCEVSYVDYGNHEFVPYNNIYEIPNFLLEKKCFSIRFALSGYKELEPINDNIKNIFKDLVLYKSFKLKVTPLEGPPLVQYCELYNENNENIFEILKQHKNRKITFAPNEELEKSDIVIVCYIESPKKFFVQKLQNQISFESMMDDLFMYCNKNKSKLKNFTNGTPCAVKFENAWYRAEIIDSIKSNRITIRHIDFGNIRKCDPNHLNEIAEKFTIFPPQAIQCCLKGFESSDMQTAENTITQFEMLAESSEGERRQFKTNIFKMHSSVCYLLNLIDDTLKPELNLMKRLFKLNMPFNKYIGLEKENFNNINNCGEAPKPIDIQETSKSNENGNQINWDKESLDSNDNSKRNNGFRGSPKQQQSRRNNMQQNDVKNKRDPNLYDRSNRNSPSKVQNQRRQSQQTQKDNWRSNSSSSSNSYEKNKIPSETSGIFSHSTKENTNNDWSMQSVSQFVTEEYIPMEQQLNNMNIILPSQEEAIICWWISPHQFFVHHKNRTNKFEQMMKDIQIFYKNKETTKLPINVNATIIARYHADNTLYRAKVLACNLILHKYKVEFIDFGNQSIITDNDIWQIEKRFAHESIMAKLCSLENIVSQFDHQHITNEMEKYLKPGSTVTCNYLSEKNSIYYVDIELNGKSLKKILKENGLISELIDGTMLEILIGQQIKVHIVSVKDLINFQILIEGCEIKLLCSYNNIKLIKTNPKLSSEFKQNYEGKFCMLDVIDVTRENILMVQPLIEMFTNEIPPVICNYPVISDLIKVKIPYVANPYKFYAHPLTIIGILDELLDDMYNYYENDGDMISEPKVGYLCAANSSDGNWYRAQIITKLNDSIEVFFIDYGNNEIIDNIKKLKRLDDKFLTTSALATEIYFPIEIIENNNKNNIINNKDSPLLNHINSLVLDSELEIKLIDKYEKSWIVDILWENISLKNALMNEGFSTEADDIEFIKKRILSDNKTKYNYLNYDIEKQTTEIIQPIEICVEKEEINQTDVSTTISSIIPKSKESNDKTALLQKERSEAYISHCDNPGRFFLQLTSDLNDLNKMQDNIQIVASSLPPLMCNVTGANCIALYGVDKCWYRAKIIDNEIMAVQFIDYGNTDVDIDPENIREMNEAFAKIKSFAIPCSLAVAPKDTTDWVDTANEIFLESLDNIVHFDLISMSKTNNCNDKNYINLYIDNKNVADLLCSENLAKKLECIESGGSCFVSHLTNLSEFYLELENDAQGLELIAEYLADYEKFPIIEQSKNNANVGKICAGLFPDDGQWYRAKILSECDDGFEVLYIDFGNKAVTNEIRELSEEIANVPFLAKKCSLRMPDFILGWSDEAENVFSELAASGEQVFTVELKKPTSECAIVDLLVDDKNLLEILEPLCDQKPENEMNISTSTEIAEIINVKSITKSIIISHINSPADFYVQLSSNISDLERITKILLNEIKLTDNIIKNPKDDEICAAIYPDDGALYRAKVLSKETNGFNVIFIDFGNCSLTTDLRKLPESLLNIEPIAINCCLQSNDIDLKSSQAIEKFNSLIGPIINKTIDMKICSEISKPFIVQIFSMNLNIGEQLKIDLNSKIKLKKVVVSHVTSSNEFYVQFESEAEKVEKITEMLLNMEKLKKITENVKCGEIYAAIFPDDQCYYRAKILNTNEKESQVFFIDFGNTAMTTDLCEMPGDLKNLQNLANKCKLYHNLNKKFSNELIEKNFISLMDSHFGEIFEMEIIETTSNDDNKEFCWNVKLFVNNSDITNELENLITINLNTNNDSIESKSINHFKKCTISHCNSANDFYIQLSSDTNHLDDITQKLTNAEMNFSILSSPQLNDLCAAKFPDDGAYYRAKILNINSNGCEVLYIDFGNIAITNDLRILPNELKIINGYGKNCKLENLFDINFLNKITIDSFNNIINSHLNETFQVDVINTINIPWIVKLYYQDNNIGDKLYLDVKQHAQQNHNNTNNTNNNNDDDETTMWDLDDSRQITNDIMSEITDNDKILTHEILDEVIDSFVIEKNCNLNSTKDLAQQLYDGYQVALSDPNVLKLSDEEIK